MSHSPCIIQQAVTSLYDLQLLLVLITCYLRAANEHLTLMHTALSQGCFCFFNTKIIQNNAASNASSLESLEVLSN